MQEVKLNKEIYIHVGPPKTGTSAVQKWLSSNQSFLKKQGVFYPSHSVDANGVSSGNVKSVYDIDENKQLCLNKVRLTNLIDTFHKSEYSILLLSSEFFFREMDEFKLHIPNAKFIAYIRNPLETKESSYNQSVKRHFQVKKINVVRRKQLPFMVRLVEFSEQFGEQDLVLRLYGERYFHHNNIVSDLLTVIGIELNVELPLVNNSYQFEAREFKRWFNQFHLEDYQANVDRALQGYLEGCGQYSLIPQKQYIDDLIYYASMLEKYTTKLGASHLGPLITDMKTASPNPYVAQELTDSDFLSVCQYLQKTLGLDYYLLTQDIKLLSPIQNPHFHNLFVKSCNRKYRYIHLLLVGRSYLRRLVKKSIKALSLKF